MAKLFKNSLLPSLICLRVLNIGLKKQLLLDHFGLGNEICLPPQVYVIDSLVVGVSVVVDKFEKVKKKNNNDYHVLSIHYVHSHVVSNSILTTNI